MNLAEIGELQNLPEPENKIRHVPWDEKGLAIYKLMLKTSFEAPIFDIAFCHGYTRHGERVHVDLPVDTLPILNTGHVLYNLSKRYQAYPAGLFSAIVVR